MIPDILIKLIVQTFIYLVIFYYYYFEKKNTYTERKKKRNCDCVTMNEEK